MKELNGCTESVAATKIQMQLAIKMGKKQMLLQVSQPN